MRALWMPSVKTRPSEGSGGCVTRSVWGKNVFAELCQREVLFRMCLFLWLMSELFGTIKGLEMQERTGGAF